MCVNEYLNMGFMMNEVNEEFCNPRVTCTRMLELGTYRSLNALNEHPKQEQSEGQPAACSNEHIGASNEHFEDQQTEAHRRICSNEQSSF